MGSEPEAYRIECPHDGCSVGPSYEPEWPPEVPEDWECGICGTKGPDFIVTPLYAATPTPTGEEADDG